MVNFRFHLLSLTAVFLALAVGIAIGATVVDQATVDALQQRLNAFEATQRENERLQARVDEWQRFSEQAADEFVEGRLPQHPILIVTVQGVDEAPVDRFRQSLSRAGALITGTISFTSKLRLDKTDDVVALSQILGLPRGRPDELRRAMITRLASSWAGSGEATPLPALIAGAFAEFESPQGIEVDPASLPRLQTKFVVVSDESADVPNDLLAIPFTTQLAKSFPASVLAAEPEGTAFVGPLRQGEVANTLATVDNLGDFRGRMAAVLAVQDLANKKVGHYGTGPRAGRLVPEPA